MSISVDNISELKNELNLIVTKRREAIDKQLLFKNNLKQLEAKLLNTLSEEDTAILKLQIQQTETLVNTTTLEIKQQMFDIDALLTTEQIEKYSQFKNAFTNHLVFTDISNNNNIEVTFISQDYIKCQFDGIQFKTQEQQLIIYPVITLIADNQNSFFIIPTASIQFFFNLSKDEAVVAQNTISIIIPTLYEATFAINNKLELEKIQTSITAYLNLLQLLNSPGLQGIKKEFYQTVTAFADKHITFVNELNSNSNFVKHVANDQKNEVTDKYINSLALLDMLKCFNSLAKIKETTSNESFAMMYVQSKFNDFTITNYEEITKLNDTHVAKIYTDFIAAHENILSSKEKTTFELGELLKSFDRPLYLQYLSQLYQFASLIIKADGKVTRAEEDILKNILVTNQEDKTVHKILISDPILEEKSLEQLIYDLYDLTGLQTVKQEINTLINLIKIKKAREGFDLKNTEISLHIVFSGNPGTGKTTVARHLGKIYKSIGVINKGHLVETDRSGMIAEYVGQTAIKVNKLVDSALDGVLFIDEAYALLTDDKDTYGKEALATLLKRMEDDRGRLIVVLAGYSDEMTTLIESNPGLKSRFNKYIHFEDYTVIELYSIFIGMSRKLNFNLQPGLADAIKQIFEMEIAKGEKSFDNGRFVRNLFEKMIEKQANRLTYDVELNREKLTTLMIADLPDKYLSN
jgi:AAA+ superfamily predicted ATPase